MKKSNKLVKRPAKLRLDKETIRVLTAVELDVVDGGQHCPTTCDMGQTCVPPNE